LQDNPAKSIGISADRIRHESDTPPGNRLVTLGLLAVLALLLGVLPPQTSAHQPIPARVCAGAPNTGALTGLQRLSRCERRVERHARKHCGPAAAPAAAIRCTWPRQAWHAALTVARCESSLNPRARNGQYRGIFQMGSAERARFGHSRFALGQARAALRYWRLAGWAPWSCKP
jgi:hypothetical protein